MLRPARYHERQWSQQAIHATIVCILLLRITPFVRGAPALGRATFYGNGDGFTLNDGSCACHKRWGWLSNRCESGHCFDYIGSPLPADGDGLVAAINTPGLSNTGQCGVCYDITCAPGPTRGLPDAEFPDSGCISNRTISVMITDSCPCKHANKSNKKWCCGDMTHLDLSYQAFSSIADPEKGVINIMFERLPFCSAADHDVNTQTCDRYYGVVYTADLWKLAAGVAVCFVTAGFVVGSFVSALYRNEQQRQSSASGS